MSNNQNNTPKAPNTHSQRGSQTPTYSPPPMPNVAPAKPSSQSNRNK